MKKQNNETLLDTRRGWIFCLNAREVSRKGSNWGYSEDFIEDILAGANPRKDVIEVDATTDGTPYSKHALLAPGDGIAFYHGKKSRQSTRKPNRHVKPYQITLVARIDALSQNPETGDVENMKFSSPKPSALQ